MEKEERDKGRETVRRREHIGEEERNRGRENVRRRRGSSYYKWQSLPGAYDKGLSVLQGIEISLNCCHSGKVSLPSTW